VLTTCPESLHDSILGAGSQYSNLLFTAPMFKPLHHCATVQVTPLMQRDHAARWVSSIRLTVQPVENCLTVCVCVCVCVLTRVAQIITATYRDL